MNPTSKALCRESTGTMVLDGLGSFASGRHQRVVQTWIVEQGTPDPLSVIETMIESYPKDEDTTQSGWFMMLSYELGRVIEPKAQHIDSQTGSNPTGFPLAVIQRWETCIDHDPEHPGDYAIGQIESSMGKSEYIAAVGRVQEYIRQGDVYQANIAHHLRGSFSGNARSCFDAMSKAASPRLGSLMVYDHYGARHAIASVSPEVFVMCDLNDRTIRTEPMKGTRPAGADENELRDSTKDRAELDMITDLMRNDLGRVCVLGSVHVIEQRKIESHRSGVLQASSVIEGKLAQGVGIGEVIKATFPPGSVTGAPKVRAMQIIDEIEQADRDSYCGATLVMTDAGKIEASVSIRTAHIWGEIVADDTESMRNGHFVYPVGAGIVADSDPESEWAETLVKARILESSLGIDLPDEV